MDLPADVTGEVQLHKYDSDSENRKEKAGKEERWQKKWTDKTRVFKDDWIGEKESSNPTEDVCQTLENLSCTNAYLELQKRLFICTNAYFPLVRYLMSYNCFRKVISLFVVTMMLALMINRLNYVFCSVLLIRNWFSLEFLQTVWAPASKLSCDLGPILGKRLLEEH